jgi:hypothetical protein
LKHECLPTIFGISVFTYAINWKVAGSIPDGVIGFLNCPIPSCRTMTLELKSTNRNEVQEYSWGKEQLSRRADNFAAMSYIKQYSNQSGLTEYNSGERLPIPP